MIRRRIGPHSRLITRGNIDGRSREGRCIRAMRVALAEHVGGSPTATQAALIESAAMLAVRLALLDEKMIAGSMTEIDSRTYLAWSGSLRRALLALGLKEAPAKLSTIADALAEGRTNDEAAT